MKLQKVAGATSEIWQVFIQDSSSTTGAGLTGLVFNTSSLTAYFHRDTDTTATAITLVTMTAGTFTSSGFKEVDATNMPGVYQLCPPNTALAAGAKSVVIMLKGATNMAPLAIETQLTAVNPDSASAFVSGVNVTAINAVSAASVSAVNANVGTTQPLNFTGTAGAATVKGDVVNIAGTASAGAAGKVALDFTTPTIPLGVVPIAGIVDNGTAQSVTGTTLVMRSAAAFADSELVGATVVIMTATTGAGQRRLITANVGSTDTLTVDTWTTTPTGTITYAIFATPPGSVTAPSPVNVAAWNGTTVATPATAGVPDINVKNAGNVAWGSGAITAASLAADTGLKPIRSNTATAGAATTITLDASASAVDHFYENSLILTTGGTGAGQARFITGYVGSTKVATVRTWVTNPDATTTFAILPFDAVAGATAPTAAQVATAVWTDLLAGSDFSTASSIGKLLKDDIDVAISTRLAPTTGGRTLDVTTTGEAGIDWANIGAPTTAVALTGTTISTSQVAASVTAGVAVASIATDAVNAAALATDAVAEIVAATFARSFGASWGSHTFDDFMKVIGAAAAAKVSGAATGAPVFRNWADSADVITATTDANGNRTAVTLSP